MLRQSNIVSLKVHKTFAPFAFFAAKITIFRCRIYSELAKREARQITSVVLGLIWATVKIGLIMTFDVTITESYTYTTRIECADEKDLSRIIHEDVPLIAVMTKAEVERLRKNGLYLHCEFKL